MTLLEVLQTAEMIRKSVHLNDDSQLDKAISINYMLSKIDVLPQKDWVALYNIASTFVNSEEFDRSEFGGNVKEKILTQYEAMEELITTAK